MQKNLCNKKIAHINFKCGRGPPDRCKWQKVTVQQKSPQQNFKGYGEPPDRCKSASLGRRFTKKFTYNGVNIDITYEGHQNCLKNISYGHFKGF